MIIENPKLIFPDIAADLFDRNDICSFCGDKLVAVDKVEERFATACVNRSCQFRNCSCVSDLKNGVETLNCQVHWRCGCREGYLCGRHKLRPNLVQSRYKVKGKSWADATGFSTIHAQANLWIQACNEQEKKALAHCGSCFSVLKPTDKTPGSACPKGCICNCADKIECHVHMTCSCLDGYQLCKFHAKKRPDVIVALYRALPPPGRRSSILMNKLLRADINIKDFPQKGRAPKELDLKELVRQAGLVITKPSSPTSKIERPLPERGPDKAKPSPILDERKRSPRNEKIADFDLASDLKSKLDDYKDWLSKQGLSPHSARNYLSRVKGFIAVIGELDMNYSQLSLTNKDTVVRDLKNHLQKKLKLKPATLNSYLAAVDNFYGFLGLGKTEVVRLDLAQEAPQALTPKDQKRFLRAVELTRRKKDRALATLLFYTGMRLSECANLELNDVFLVGRKTRAIIRYGKGGRYRELPLNSAVCEALQSWLMERNEKFAGRSVAPSLFLNPQGKQMLPNSIYEVIRKIGRDAGLELSPHTLRHTCLTTLIRNHNDVILVADIAGHKSLNTTRRYTLPSQADKARALEDMLE